MIAHVPEVRGNWYGRDLNTGSPTAEFCCHPSCGLALHTAIVIVTFSVQCPELLLVVDSLATAWHPTEVMFPKLIVPAELWLVVSDLS